MLTHYTKKADAEGTSSFFRQEAFEYHIVQKYDNLWYKQMKTILSVEERDIIY